MTTADGVGRAAETTVAGPVAVAGARTGVAAGVVALELAAGRAARLVVLRGCAVATLAAQPMALALQHNATTKARRRHKFRWFELVTGNMRCQLSPIRGIQQVSRQKL